MSLIRRLIRINSALAGLFLFALFPLSAQGQFKDWQTHTSMRQIVDLTSTDAAIWAATEGGVFRYGVESGDISRFTTTEGLYGLNIRAIQYDRTTHSIWVGYLDGVLDRIDIETSTVKSFLDIPRATQFPERDIRKLITTGDTLIVATGFGVVLFDTDREEVIETFSRFGAAISVGPVEDIAITTIPDGARRLWVVLSSENVKAVVSAPLAAPNLQDPAAWQTETVGNGQVLLHSVAGHGNHIYVGSENGLFIRDAMDTYRLLDVTNGTIESLIPLPDQLIGLEPFSLIVVDNAGNTRRVGSGGLLRLTDLLSGPNGLWWVSDFQEGLTAFEPIDPGTSIPTIARESFFPSGPFDGKFSELTFDREGNLWLGGIPGSDTGFYKFDREGEWTSYIKRFFEELQGRPTRYEFIHTDSQSNVWAGSFGGGLARVDQNGEISFFDETNSTLEEVTTLPNSGFVIVRGISSEPDGTLWVANTGSGRPLHLRLLDGSWTGFPSILGSSLTYERIFVDSFRQKWIVTVSQNNLQRKDGLLILDTGDDIERISDDVFQYFSESGSNGQGLPSPVVNTIAEDKSGRIWVGTDEGLAYFVNTGILALDPNSIPIWPLRSSRQQGESQFLLFGLKINTIAVDPADNLWVGTDIGAFYVTGADLGFEVVTQLTSQNSPLLSDVILSIAVDKRTGEVYFSTDQGLISLQGDAIAPAEDKQDLFIYPNPVRIEGQSEPEIFIEGLVDETNVRILTISGALVADLEARGGRIRWNGKDRSNQLVPSGMYIVVALDKNGSGSAYGKVAVIR